MRLAACLTVLLVSGDAWSQERYAPADSSSGPLPFMNAPPESGGAPAPPDFSNRRAGSGGAGLAQPMETAPSAPAARSHTEADAAPPSPYAPDAAPPEVSPPELMGEMLTAPGDSRLNGRPVTLAEVIAAGGTRDEQTVRINAYWDLCSSVADYYLGLTEARELQVLQQRLAGLKAADAVDVEAARVRDRVGASHTAAAAAQMRLASLMDASQPLLPADPPHCGGYDTMYERVFADRRSAEAMNLDRLIPLRYAELRAAAQGVGRAEAWVARVAKLQTRNSTGAGILRSLELLALNRRAFVQIAKDYNRQITRYVELARPGRIEDQRLVRMHLGARSSATAANPSQPTRASQAGPSQPYGTGRR